MESFAKKPAQRKPSWLFLAAVAAVAILQIALILTHDYFVDEWQALQIAVQSPDLPALLANLRYEGHPPLWYLLLRGLSGIFGPGNALRAASLLCALTTVCLIARFAPWPFWVRIAVMLAEPILFEYGTISRGASLGVALTFAALALWRRPRAIWALLALLPLVDFLFGVIAMALILLRVGERHAPWWPGVALFAFCSAFAAWTVIPAPDFISVYPPSTIHVTLARWTSEMAVVMLPVQWHNGPQWDAPWQTPLTPLLGVGFLLLAYHQTRDRPVERAVVIGYPLILLAFMLAVHTLSVRHLLLAAVVYLAVLWRQGAATVPIGKPTAGWLVMSALCGLAAAGLALTRPFDTAPAAARTVEQMGLSDETWLSFPAQHAQGVAAMTAIAFESAELGCRHQFIRWNFRHRLTEPEQLRDWLSQQAKGGGTFYLLTQYEPDPGGAARRIATIPPGLDGKAYYLYRVTGGKAGRRSAAPPCVEGIDPLPPLGT